MQEVQGAKTMLQGQGTSNPDKLYPSLPLGTHIAANAKAEKGESMFWAQGRVS